MRTSCWAPHIEGRVRCLVRENGLQAALQPGRARGPRSHEGTSIPKTIDTMWGTT
jgi:hypothetical protein